MRILGIDPGTATTGYGLIEQDHQNQLIAIEYGVITTPAVMPPAERLLVIHNQIKELLLLHKPDSAAVEKLFFQRNVSTAIAVGQSRGVVLLALAQAGISFEEYTPNEVKQAVSGYGAADKKQIQQMVKLLLRLDIIPQPDDAADALAIAICHASTIHWKAGING
jgi:crossover junction endodeoxyribonuclease RuvC